MANTVHGSVRQVTIVLNIEYPAPKDFGDKRLKQALSEGVFEFDGDGESLELSGSDFVSISIKRIEVPHG